MSVKSFLSYLKHEKRYSPHTLKAYENDLTSFHNFLKEQLEIERMSAVRAAYIRSWMVDMVEQGITARSINRKLSSLKSYFKFLLRRKEIKTNPMVKIQAPKNAKRLPSFLTEQNMDRLLNDLPFHPDYSGQRDKMVLELLYNCGMRKAELIGLKLGDIDFSRNVIKVLGKGNKERFIPIQDELKQTLKRFIQTTRPQVEAQSDHLLLTDKGKALYPKLVYNITKKYLALVTTADKKSPHVLRHTFATHLSNNGADINALKDLLGHSSLAATQVYTHNSIEQLKEAYKTAHPKS